MNRRRFMQSVAAMFALPSMPSLSLRSATAAVPAATAVPTQARFWGIYMSALHGECPPHALESLLNIPSSDAKRYVTQLIADGVIKPHPLMQKTVTELVKTQDDSVLGKIKKRLEMKSQSGSDEMEVSETVEVSEGVEPDLDLSDENSEVELEAGANEELLDDDIEILDDFEPQNEVLAQSQ